MWSDYFNSMVLRTQELRAGLELNILQSEIVHTGG